MLHGGKVQLMTRGFSQNSSLYAQLEGDQHNGTILGDSGYAQTNVLFNPYLHAVTPEQQRYNQVHGGLVEHTFGVRKSRFQCLRNTLHFEPRRWCTMIIATAVLHDYIKQRGWPDPEVEDDNDPEIPVVEANKDI